MNVLMISIDRGLLGAKALGDVIERHRQYGKHVDRLDIIVLSSRGFSDYEISDRVHAYPTNSRDRLRYFFGARKIAKKLSANTYDLIVTQEPFIAGLIGVMLRRQFKAKLLVHFHGDFWNNSRWIAEHPLNRVLLPLSYFVARKADVIRVMSAGQRETLIARGIPDKKIHVVSTPVDISKFEVIEHVPTAQPHVLHVGRPDMVKDYDTLIGAWNMVAQKMPSVQFHQVGGKREVLAALERIHKSRVKVNLSIGEAGNVTADDQLDQSLLLDFYRQASVFVLSSRSESFGKVFVEANAAGLPIVSTATTGAQEVITDGENGFLVPIGDAQKLAEKIIYLLEHPDVVQKMGARGRQSVKERFGDNLQKIIALWQEIVKL